MKTAIKIFAIIVAMYVVIKFIDHSLDSLPQYDVTSSIASNIDISYLDAIHISDNYYVFTVRFLNYNKISIRKLTAKFEIYNNNQLIGSFIRDIVNNNYLIAPNAPYDYKVYFQSPSNPSLATHIIYASD